MVDDEPDLRTLYELTLLREGYDIETAGTVQDALLHLKDRTYSAVITDMRRRAQVPGDARFQTTP